MTKKLRFVDHDSEVLNGVLRQFHDVFDLANGRWSKKNLVDDRIDR